MTFCGSNHDAWFTKPHIWFENATSGRFGAAFTGARFDGENGYAPQSGMNERGLVFEILAAYHPVQEKFQNRKTISNPTKYLKDILHKKIGDGTLLSSIWDCNKGTVNLYFYHDYMKTVQFVLSEELKKGDRIIAIETLFPQNPELKKLRNFKTPIDSILIGLFIVASAGFFY